MVNQKSNPPMCLRLAIKHFTDPPHLLLCHPNLPPPWEGRGESVSYQLGKDMFDPKYLPEQNIAAIVQFISSTENKLIHFLHSGLEKAPKSSSHLYRPLGSLCLFSQRYLSSWACQCSFIISFSFFSFFLVWYPCYRFMFLWAWFGMPLPSWEKVRWGSQILAIKS